MLDPTKELAIRTALGNKIAAVTGSVFIRPELFDSKQDWVESLGVQVIDGETELRACTVDLLPVLRTRPTTAVLTIRW
jgi:hypothetical protein